MDRLRDLDNERILLVEDDRLIREALATAFSRKGFRVTAVESAEDGLIALRNQCFSVIISDFQLLGINGLVFFQQVVAQDESAVKILMSGCVDSSQVSEALQNGIDAFLQKPFKLESVYKMVLEHLKNRQADKLRREAFPEFNRETLNDIV